MDVERSYAVRYIPDLCRTNIFYDGAFGNVSTSVHARENGLNACVYDVWENLAISCVGDDTQK